MKKRVALIGLLTIGLQGVAQPIDVSMLSLIAAPKDFDGKQVRVIGFARLEFEGNAIYLHKEDYLHGILKNGLWLDIDSLPRKAGAIPDNQYVIVEGTFSMKDQGHLGLWAGSIQKITRLDRWKP